MPTMMRPDLFERSMALLVVAFTACAIFTLIARLFFGWYESRHGAGHEARCANADEEGIAPSLQNGKDDVEYANHGDGLALRDEAFRTSSRTYEEPVILLDDDVLPDEDEALTVVLEPPTDETLLAADPGVAPHDDAPGVQNRTELDALDDDDDDDLTERTFTF
jgi:hypothetical protein